jgi:hypothetical protein
MVVTDGSQGIEEQQLSIVTIVTNDLRIEVLDKIQVLKSADQCIDQGQGHIKALREFGPGPLYLRCSTQYAEQQLERMARW